MDVGDEIYWTSRAHHDVPPPNEFALALVTAVTVVTLGVEKGIIVAVFLSFPQYVRDSYGPLTGVLVPDAADRWRLEDPVPGKVAEPDLVIFWFG